MRTDRGPVATTPDPPLTTPDKVGSRDSLNGGGAVTSPPTQATPRAGTFDGNYMSDPDDDTATFKSALSSSEAIRRGENGDKNGTSVHLNNNGTTKHGPLAPATAPPPDGKLVKLWQLSGGDTPQNIAEKNLAGNSADSSHPVHPRLPNISDVLSPDSLSQVHSGAESLSFGTSGPESLNMTEDDYYEDFTMPGTHEPVMSRQMSFRRRVRAAPVSVPDADRIEGVVRAGELERHGSIRRRLVAQPTPPLHHGSAATPTSNGSPGRFGRDLKEIEELMAEHGDEVFVDELPSLGPVLGTSTPKYDAEQPASLPPHGEEPISMEMSTVMKIKGCLDREKVRDIYKISGRLQDILTQEDIQEILEHQELYAELLGEELLMELKNSMSESQQSSPPRSAPPTEMQPMSDHHPLPASTSVMSSTELNMMESKKPLHNLNEAEVTSTIANPGEPSSQSAFIVPSTTSEINDATPSEPELPPPLAEASDKEVHPRIPTGEPRDTYDDGYSTGASTIPIPPDQPLHIIPPEVLYQQGAIDPNSSPDATPPGSPHSSIQVCVEINLPSDRSAPVAAPRSRISVPAEIASDPEIDAASSAGAPSPAPPAERAAQSAAAERADSAEGRLWRTGSLRRLRGPGGGSVEALFAESDAPPKPGRRRIAAPSISISLDDSDRTLDSPLADASEAEEAEGTPQRRRPKPTDADSGVSDGTLAKQSGDDAADEPPAPAAARTDERPSTLAAGRRRKISVPRDVLTAPDGVDDDESLSLSTTRHQATDSELATPTDTPATSELADTLTPDGVATPDEVEESILERLPAVEPIPEYPAQEERQQQRAWRTCVVAGLERRIDMKVIEPYKKVLSHGGYLGQEAEQAIIVFSACYLPSRSRRDYSYVMDNLFLYVLSTLDALIADDYVLIYLHGATQRACMPSFGWLKRCYQMVDRRLRKNLKGLYLVHPTFWVKTIVALTRPFISSKFSRKLRFVADLRHLCELVPMDHVCIPDRVKQLDFQLMISERKKQLGIR